MEHMPFRARNTRMAIRARSRARFAVGSRSAIRAYSQRVAHVRNTIRGSSRAMTGLRGMAARARARIAARGRTFPGRRR